jgi:uncharacterized protein (UPF0335 family)
LTKNAMSAQVKVLINHWIAQISAKAKVLDHTRKEIKRLEEEKSELMWEIHEIFLPYFSSVFGYSVHFILNLN